MIPGDYEVAHVELLEESDGMRFTTLAWGYDTAEDAAQAAPKVAKENGVDLEDIAILRVWALSDFEQS